MINVKADNRLGQFIIPKSELIARGIIRSVRKEGKRGFRVYPIWDEPKNKQAHKSQAWQLKYFLEINESTDLDHANKLYQFRS